MQLRLRTLDDLRELPQTITSRHVNLILEDLFQLAGSGPDPSHEDILMMLHGLFSWRYIYGEPIDDTHASQIFDWLVKHEERWMLVDEASGMRKVMEYHDVLRSLGDDRVRQFHYERLASEKNLEHLSNHVEQIQRIGIRNRLPDSGITAEQRRRVVHVASAFLEAWDKQAHDGDRPPEMFYPDSNSIRDYGDFYTIAAQRVDQLQRPPHERSFGATNVMGISKVNSYVDWLGKDHWPHYNVLTQFEIHMRQKKLAWIIEVDQAELYFPVIAGALELRVEELEEHLSPSGSLKLVGDHPTTITNMEDLPCLLTTQWRFNETGMPSKMYLDWWPEDGLVVEF